MTVQIIDAQSEIVLIPGVLTPEECADLIAYSEDHGYHSAPISTSRGPVMASHIRNNTRVMLDEPERARWLAARLHPWLPPQARAGWHLAGLNERLRWYRYDPGERFNWHLDGSFVRSRDERSFLTVMVYLNEDFTGGETSFDLRSGFRVVHPRAGAALLFPHPLRHTGAVVHTGRKYVLRTDAMYARS